MHCREIKEFQSEALECLAASQLSYEEINSIVVSGPFPCAQSPRFAYCTPAPFSLRGAGSATAGSAGIQQHKLTELPTFIFCKNPPVLSGIVGFVTFSTRWTVAVTVPGTLGTHPKLVSGKPMMDVLCHPEQGVGISHL